MILYWIKLIDIDFLILKEDRFKVKKKKPNSH